MSTTFANTIDGNEILAKRSQCDYAGNDIQTTYAKKSELPTATSDLTNDSGFITSSDVPVKDVQVAGESVVNAQGIAEISIPQTGVLDVEVDGSSVVNAQGVAEITLPTFTQVNADWDASSGVAQILNKPSIPTATSDLTNDSGFITLSDVPAQVNSDWNSSSGASEILNKPTIPSGTQLVPAATSADADKVLTVNAQGTPAWATAQAPISAGDGIDITNNVVSAKVDGTTIDTNASGELTVIGGGGGTQVNSDWDATSGVAEILNKPVPKTLTAGTGISISENQSTITIASSVAAITMPTPPTVDQTYDASSANAQSGIAVADAIGNLPTNLTSAQIQALKEALGVDETVLWEGSKTAPDRDNQLSLSVTFDETVANFEYLKIFYWYRTTTNTAWKVDICYVDGGEFHFTYQWPENATGNWFMYRLYGSGTSASGDGGYKPASGVNTWGSYGGGMWGNGTIWKVVGVHRIANN